MKDFKLFIFDLDGTLVNTLDDITDAVNAVLRKNNIRPVSTDRVRLGIGKGVDFLFRTVAGSKVSPAEAKKLFKYFYSRHLTDRSVLYPGILAVLKLLRKKKKKIHMLSNKPHNFSERILMDLSIRKYFDLIKGINGTEKEKLKPSPYYVLRSIKIEKVLPYQTVVIGDTYTDILSARNAGAFSCAALYGFRSYSELKKYKPDFYVRKPSELYCLLKK